jgi:hypothetical protein
MTLPRRLRGEGKLYTWVNGPPLFLRESLGARGPILSEKCVIYLTNVDKLAHLSDA